MGKLEFDFLPDSTHLAPGLHHEPIFLSATHTDWSRESSPENMGRLETYRGLTIIPVSGL
ncbi:hypothetical protein SBA7_1580007 [Candidatus Sulfotelmatobacter sp. SbA7]|nr:hypothetical protein SBA7_1580007 [Candidatus Sulfotelmatobacter sp. SbA7]